jgi:hypothetical protein
VSHINDLEKYLYDLQSLEIGILEDKSAIDAIVHKYSVKPTTYSNLNQLVLLRKELEEYLDSITPAAGKIGKLMSQKAMSRFLEKSEYRELTRKQLSAINKLNNRQIARRIDLYKKKILKETNYLKEEIEEFFINAKISGRNKKQVLAELIKAARDNEGITKGFSKKIKRIAIDSARRESQQRAVEEYRKIAIPGEKWEWILISSKPCPDCIARAGVILPYQTWVSNGTPGAGRTICGSSCKCQLVPVSVSDELFPDEKSYNWDKD